MKKITIPKEFGYPTTKVWVNGDKYILETGKEIEVTEEVAEVIEAKIKIYENLFKPDDNEDSDTGGGESVQPDLAQNDETAPDYVKNRTHYEAVTVHNSVEEVVIGTSPIPGNYGRMPSPFCPNNNVAMPEGKYIRIVMGGVPYKITNLPAKFANAYRETITLGNGVSVVTELTAANANNQPDRKYLYYRAYPEVAAPELEPYVGTPFTVELVSDEIKKLDKKFLPDDIGGGSQVLIVECTERPDNYDYKNSYDITLNKTGEEIYSAWENKIPVFLNWYNYLIPLANAYGPDELEFVGATMFYAQTNFVYLLLEFSSDSQASVYVNYPTMYSAHFSDLTIRGNDGRDYVLHINNGELSATPASGGAS